MEFDGTTRIKAKLGALAVTIYMEKARKFASTADQVQYEHLNVDIESGIPDDAKGIFAELAGVQTVSEATAALLRPPRATSFVGAPPRPLEDPCHSRTRVGSRRIDCYTYKPSYQNYACVVYVGLGRWPMHAWCSSARTRSKASMLMSGNLTLRT